MSGSKFQAEFEYWLDQLQPGLIVLLCIVAACGYGIAHDQVTVRICEEYYTVGHFMTSESATLMALSLGIRATWWMGAGLGILVALAARAGSLPTMAVRAIVRPVLIVLVAMSLVAAGAGIVGRVLAINGKVWLEGYFAGAVDRSQHVNFITALWSHRASYVSGGVGGVVVAAWAWRKRVLAAKLMAEE